MNDALLLLICIVSASLCRLAGRPWGTPFAVFYVVWAVIFLLRQLLPMGLTPTSSMAVAIVGTGLAALAAGLVIASPPVAQLRPGIDKRALSATGIPGASRPAGYADVRRLLLVATVLLAAILVGIWQHRTVIASQAGMDFASLTRQQVLYYQTYRRPIESNPAFIFLSLCPVLAAVGVVLGRRNPTGYLLVAAALACSMQNPSRTATISTALLALIVHLSLPPKIMAASKQAELGRVRLLALIVIAAVGTIVYFNTEADALRKTVAPHPSLPAELGFLAGPLLYATGSLSALSVAAYSPDQVPPNTDEMRSIWLVPRVLSVIDPDIEVPRTITGFVGIPTPYNTYTMFGDLYFDFGLGGVAFACTSFGVLVGWLQRRNVNEPNPHNAVMSAVGIVVLFGGVIVFRLFWLDTVTWFVTGGAVLAWARHRRRDPPKSGTEPTGGDVTTSRIAAAQRRDTPTERTCVGMLRSDPVKEYRQGAMKDLVRQEDLRPESKDLRRPKDSTRDDGP